jgi:DNA-binding Lrp family transcriptional regulator
VPGMSKTKLDRDGIRRLRAAEKKIAEARLEWAATVRDLGISAVAREVDLTPQALQQRIKRIESEKGQPGVPTLPPRKR